MTHMDYKRTGKTHSFRGLLADGGQDKIRIQGPVGDIAWRITKFAILGPDGNSHVESSIKIYREKQTSIDGTINFGDADLLGAALYSQNSSAHQYPVDIVVIFDNALFSRNIYVTQSETVGSASCNYYIELEEVKVGKAGMAQLAVAAARRTID